MVSSFATIANGGNYIEPQIVTSVEDRSGSVLASFIARSAEQAMSNQAAMTLLDVLRGVVDGGTAAGLKPRFGLSGDLAGKTGTTQDNTDGWFILMHPQLVMGSWMGFNDNRVTMRSEYWGQGAHNALFVVGDFMQQASKIGAVDSKAAFAAPRMKDEPPLLERMGDWWNSVFNTPPSAGDPTVAAVPEVQLPAVKLEPPVLEPPPKVLSAPEPLPPLPLPPQAGSNAPVIVGEPQRVPAFPRPLDSGRPVETVPGTQVYRSPDTYRSPEATVRAPDPSQPADVVRAPAPSARVAPPTSSPAIVAPPGSSPPPSSSTSSMGAARESAPAREVPSTRVITIPRDTTPSSSSAPSAPGTGTGNLFGPGSSSSGSSSPAPAATGEASGTVAAPSE